MSGSTATSDQAHDHMPDAPIIIQDLVSQIEFQPAIHGDPAAIADLWAQVQLLQAG